MPAVIPKPSLRVATWNIHGGIGLDRRYRPQRIARVLKALNVDLVALQEVELDDAHADLLAALHGCGYANVLTGVAMRAGERAFGHALLTTLRVDAQRHIDLSVNGREPRAAMDVDLGDAQFGRLRVIATHLGLRGSERAAQIETLRAALADDPRPTLLLGDFNEWRHHAPRLRPLHAHLRIVTRRSFPAPTPLLSLDRIGASPALRLSEVATARQSEVRIASDHLPLVARLSLA